MTSPHFLTRPLAWVRRYPVWILGAYWMLAVVATHAPPFRPPNLHALPDLIPLDKLAHFSGYTLLALLLLIALTRNHLHRLRLGTAVVLTAAILAAYGIMDEWTQPFFARDADPWDYLADLLGCATGTVIFLGINVWSSAARRSAARSAARTAAQRGQESPATCLAET